MEDLKRLIERLGIWEWQERCPRTHNLLSEMVQYPSDSEILANRIGEDPALVEVIPHEDRESTLDDMISADYLMNHLHT